jgi:hypothetical protein
MKLNAAFLVSVICAILAISIFAAVAVHQDFPIFNSSSQSSSFVSVSQDVGGEDSRFMWNDDGLALIAQAFVLFAAAAAALGLLKGGEEKQHA